MNIVVISQMFPCRRHPTSAIFFYNLMRELAPRLGKLIVITPRPYIPKVLAKARPGLAKWFIDPPISRNGKIEIIRPRIPFLRGASNEGMNAILMQYSLYPLLKRLMRKRRVDLLLGYNMIPEGIAVVRLAKKLNLPAGFWCIGSDVNDFAAAGRLNYYLTKKTVAQSEIVITESRDLEAKVRQYSPGGDNVITFYKGIDVANFEGLPPRGELLKAMGLPAEKKYLLFVGRLIHDKGIFELANAYIQIAPLHPDLDLILAGEEIRKEALLEMFRKHGIENRVHFRGIRPYKEIGSLMRVAEMLVFPTWAEGLPNVVMEAMAAGLPVVATDVGGIPEILEDEQTGLSIPPKNVGRLVSAILRMLLDRKLRGECTENAMKLIREKFDVRKNAFELHGILEKTSNRNSCLRNPILYAKEHGSGRSLKTD